MNQWVSTNIKILEQKGEITKQALESIPLHQIVDHDSHQWQLLSTLKYKENSDILISQSLQYIKSQLRWGTFIMFLSIQCSTVLCLLLYYIFLNIAAKQFTSTQNIILISVSIAIKLLKPIFGLISDKILKQLGIKLHRRISQSIIQKSLQSSLSSYSNTLTFANMSKLIHIDIEKILTYPYKIAFVRVNIISVLCLVAILFLLLGWLGFVACSIYVTVFTVSLLHKFKNDRLEQEFVTVRDQRLKSTIQTLAIMKFIKVNALEQYIFDKISTLRTKQFATLQQLFKLDMLSIFYYMGLSKIFLPTVLLSLALLHYNIGTAIYNCLYTIFFNIFIFKIAKQISLIKEAELCIENISKLVHIQLKNHSYITHQIFRQPSLYQNVIYVKGNFYRENKTNEQQKTSRKIFQLSNIQFKLEKGVFAAISGIYGSGKTSLLQCILGQMKADIGSQIKLYGKIGYVSQKPWIMNETIRNNILFGFQFQQNRYKDAIYYSGLQHDLSILHLGDHTLIGRRGCTISGGQKVRIALARVIYSNADTFLLDDIFSAMDIHVGTFLYQETLKKFLKGKTILLVTHNIQFAKQSDIFYLIKNGQIILQKNIKTSNSKPQYSHNHRQALILTEPAQQIHQPYQRRLQQGLSLYHSRNGGTYFIVNTIIALILILALSIIYYQWNNYWAVAEDRLQAKYIIISYALCIIIGIVVVFYGIVLYGSPLYSQLHRDMLKGLLQAPPSYFQLTSSAMITSRVSSDLQICDKVLGNQYYLSLANIGTMFGLIVTFLLLNLKLNNIYLFVILALYIICLLYFCKKYAIATIYFYTQKQQHKIPFKLIYQQTLQGLTTIRSLGKSSYQQQQYMHKADQYLKTTFAYNTLQSYLNFYIGLISSLYFCSIIIFHLFLDYEEIYSNIFIASIIVNQEFLYRISSGVTEFMFKLESLIKCEELTAIESEKYAQSIVGQQNQLTLQSPYSLELFTDGEIIFKEVSLRYRSNLQTVVSNLSFSIKPKEKIGIVGRTGSGKSTLLLSILKMVQVSAGNIEIDGKNLAPLTPTQVRKQVNTILQDHFLFTGTVRQNIDPTSDHNDQQIIQILKDVGLWHKFTNQQGLLTLVHENGMNLSAGERQLLNISRALLKPKAIVLVDQATASIDSETDVLIQKVMKEKFIDSTVLTVAHRISTILSSDRIMVLQNGKICEFDSPTTLLNDKNSLFYSLLQQLKQEAVTQKPSLQKK